MPALTMAALFGTQYQYAALNDVPPRVAAFSSTMTLLPSQRENNAAGSPAPPPPQTTTSYSASNASAAAASLPESVMAPKVAAAPPAPATFRKSRREAFGVLCDFVFCTIAPPV